MIRTLKPPKSKLNMKFTLKNKIYIIYEEEPQTTTTALTVIPTRWSRNTYKLN